MLGGPFEVVEFVNVYWDFRTDQTWIAFALVFGEDQVIDVVLFSVLDLSEVLVQKVHSEFDCDWEIFTFDDFIYIIIYTVFCWCYKVIAFWINGFLKFLPCFTLGQYKQIGDMIKNLIEFIYGLISKGFLGSISIRLIFDDAS